MILVDFSHLVIVASISSFNRMEVDVDAIRLMTLTSLKNILRKHKRKYGEIVLAVDGNNLWRKEIFPYYKMNRTKAKNKDLEKWGIIKKSLGILTEEFIENFSYKVISVPEAEGDDVISVLSDEAKDDVLIVSSDKDFIQLQKNPRVRQWDYFKSRWIRHDEPGEHLTLHILKGDAGDGIPNILSDDDVFVNPDKRQKRLTQKRIDEIRQKIRENNLGSLQKNYERNRTLIDLSLIPQNIRGEILDKYYLNDQNNGHKMFNYFIEKKLKHLMSDIGDF